MLGGQPKRTSTPTRLKAVLFCFISSANTRVDEQGSLVEFRLGSVTESLIAVFMSQGYCQMQEITLILRDKWQPADPTGDGRCTLVD